MLEAADYKDKSGDDLRQMMADEQVTMMMVVMMFALARIVMIMVTVRECIDGRVLISYVGTDVTLVYMMRLRL